MDFVDCAVIFTKDVCHSINKDEDAKPSSATLPPADAALELVRAARANWLLPAKGLAAAKLVGLEPSPATDSALADALWCAWVECEASPRESKTRVASLAKKLMDGGVVSKRVLMETGEGEFLQAVELVPSYDKVFRRREIQVNTRAVFTQRKFNLLREESEGYAKLVTLLSQAGSGALTTDGLGATLAENRSLIGYFALDPNRICSLVLDTFTAQPSNNAFLQLAATFGTESLSQILGFRFSRSGALPQGLYTVAAKLIGAGHVTLEALLAHLSPKGEGIAAAWKQGQADLEAAVKRIGIVSLTSGTKTEGADAAQPTQQRRAGQSAADMDLDAKQFAVHLVTAGDGVLSQRGELLAALLRVGAWDPALRLIKWLAALGVRDVAVLPNVGTALCALLAEALAPEYARLYPGGVQAAYTGAAPRGSPEEAALIAIPERTMQLLRIIGHHLYHDMRTLTKVTRVAAAVLEAAAPGDTRWEAAVEVLGAHVLPAMALVPGCPAHCGEAWAALSKLPYTQRFCLYSDLAGQAASAPLLGAASMLAETEVRRILRRVTAPANREEARRVMRPLGRQLAKIAHAVPLAVADQLLRQVMGMPGMVASISEALKYLTPYFFDVFTFAILRQLTRNRKKLKQDGHNLEEWFQWLAAFSGVLARKHDAVEVTALAQYVANQLKSCESLDLLLLKEMVATMTGVSPVFDISDSQLDALAGSQALVAATVAVEKKDANERALARGTQRLLRALTVGPEEQQLAMPLLVLLAQQRKLITLQPSTSHLKLVAELYDRCQEVTVQYAEFLRRALPLQTYAAMLPSIKDLALEYRVDPEIIFELHRPLIRGILPPAAPLPEPTPADAPATGEGTIAEAGEVPAGEGEGGVTVEGTTAGESKEKEAPVPAPSRAVAAVAAPTTTKGDDSEEGELSEGAVPLAVMDVDVEDGEVSEEEEGALSPNAGGGSGAAAAAVAGDPSIGGGPDWEALVDQATAVIPEGGFKGMSQTLFLTFWALSLYDLDVPSACYETTLAQVRSAVRAAREDLETVRRESQRGYGSGMFRQGGYGGYGAPPPPPPPPPASVDTEALKWELERLEAVAVKLPKDLEEQRAAAAAVNARLRATAGAWVTGDTPEAEAATTREFVQFCILPRVLNSPTDAVYCARFLRKAHPLGPPGFRLLPVMDRLFKELGYLVRCSTPREATNVGIFFVELLALVARWRSPETYAKECTSSEAFRNYKGGKLEAVTHSEFVKLSANWHRKFTQDVFCMCLGSADYMQMKNALLALNRMVRIYPATKEDAADLLRVLSPIRDTDPREDLKILARMYCTALEMAGRDKNRQLVATRAEFAGKPPPKKRPRRSQAGEGEKEAGKERGAHGDRVKEELRGKDDAREKVRDRSGGTDKDEGKGRGVDLRRSGRRDDVRKDERSGDKRERGGSREEERKAELGKADQRRRDDDKEKSRKDEPQRRGDARKAEERDRSGTETAVGASKDQQAAAKDDKPAGGGGGDRGHGGRGRDRDERPERSERGGGGGGRDAGSGREAPPPRAPRSTSELPSESAAVPREGPRVRGRGTLRADAAEFQPGSGGSAPGSSDRVGERERDQERVRERLREREQRKEGGGGLRRSREDLPPATAVEKELERDSKRPRKEERSSRRDDQPAAPESSRGGGISATPRSDRKERGAGEEGRDAATTAEKEREKDSRSVGRRRRSSEDARPPSGGAKEEREQPRERRRSDREEPPPPQQQDAAKRAEREKRPESSEKRRGGVEDAGDAGGGDERGFERKQQQPDADDHERGGGGAKRRNAGKRSKKDKKERGRDRERPRSRGEGGDAGNGGGGGVAVLSDRMRGRLGGSAAKAEPEGGGSGGGRGEKRGRSEERGRDKGKEGRHEREGRKRKHSRH